MSTELHPTTVPTAHQRRIFMPPPPVPTPAYLYADGGVIAANPSPYGGTWAWCQVGADGNRIVTASGIITPEQCHNELVTNNVTELAALVFGLEALPLDFTGVVASDSWVSLQRIFLTATLKNVPEWLVDRLQALQKSGWLKLMTYQLLDGHPSDAQLVAGVGKKGNPVSTHNRWCDQECTRIGRAWRAKCQPKP